MKSLKAYLAGLDDELNTFSPGERDEILSEIEAHIADGLEDPQMGRSKEERGANLLAQLGPPSEMADGLYHAHQPNRWLELLLALLPLLIIEFVSGITTMVLFQQKFSIPEYIYMAALAVIPLYFFMLKVASQRKSVLLRLWWLSWTILYLIESLLQGVMLQSPIWPLLIWGIALCFSVPFFARQVWQVRRRGTLLAFTTLPIVLWFANMASPLLLSLEVPSPEMFGERVLWMMVLKGVFYMTFVAVICFLSERKKRWFYLIASIGTYLTIMTLVWLPLPIFQIIPFWLLLPLPLIAGMLIDYRHIYRHWLLSS